MKSINIAHLEPVLKYNLLFISNNINPGDILIDNFEKTKINSINFLTKHFISIPSEEEEESIKLNIRTHKSYNKQVFNYIKDKDIDVIIVDIDQDDDLSLRVISFIFGNEKSKLLIVCIDEDLESEVRSLIREDYLNEYVLKSLGMNNLAKNLDRMLNEELKEKLIFNKLQDIFYKDMALRLKSVSENDLESLVQYVYKMGNIPYLLRDKIDDINPNEIIKCIEFPEEHYEAGVSILTYFSTILRKKYPDNKVKVKIEQEGLNVRMIIETAEGEKEIIEKALYDYGLVITGRIPIHDYTDNKLLVLELKQQLIVEETKYKLQREQTQFLIEQNEFNKEIIKNNSATLKELQKILSDNLFTLPKSKEQSHDINVCVPVTLSAQAKSYSEANPIIDITIQADIELIDNSLKQLSDSFDKNSVEGQYLSQLTNAIEKLKIIKSQGEVKKSESVSKIQNFLNDIQKANSTANKIITTAKNGIEIGKQIAKGYNAIAQWCGLPVIPGPLLK